MKLTQLRIKRLSWLLAPSLLFMALIAGAFGVAMTHAASPLDGSYNFRAATTSGPAIGTYITGKLSLMVGGNNVINGQICGLSIAPSRCASVQGSTTDGVHVSFTFHADTLPSVVATGAFYSNPGGNASPAFFGTFTYGASSGSWNARTVDAVSYDGSYNLRAIVQSGTNVGRQFNGVLTLQQDQNNGIGGTYCVAVGSCVPVLGGTNRNNTAIFYINMGGTEYRLQGTFVGNHDGRISGRFRPATDNSATADKGYWVGHPVGA